MEEIENEIHWSVYPNPVVNELHFTLVEELPLKAIIVDAMGKTIARNIQDSRLSVSDLKPGTYWVRMEINGRIEQQAFVKQ